MRLLVYCWFNVVLLDCCMFISSWVLLAVDYSLILFVV